MVHRASRRVSLALPKNSLGLDVLLRHRDHKSFAAIARHLNEARIPVKPRSFGDASEHLLAALRGIDSESPGGLERLKQGGIALLIDGVQFDACSAVLYSRLMRTAARCSLPSAMTPATPDNKQTRNEQKGPPPIRRES